MGVLLKDMSINTGGITFQVDPDLPKPTGSGLNLRSGDDLISTILVSCDVYDDAKVIAQGIGDKKYASYGAHAFFKGMIEAFADHRPVILTPDVIWFLICQGFAHYVNDNPDNLRDLFVDHSGKMDLVVETTKDILNADADWHTIIDGFAERIRSNTKSEIADIITERFTTTGLNEHMVSQMVLMDTVKSYYEYIVMHIICGIPQITLKGTPEDWQSILDRTIKFRAYGIDWWIDKLEPILKEFVKASEGNPDVFFWRDIVMKSRPDQIRGEGCVRDPKVTKFDGWFLSFLPYGKYRSTPEAVTMDYKMQPEMVMTDYRYVVINDKTGKIEKEVMMEFWAGIVGMEVDPYTFEMTPKLGWFSRIKKTDEELLAEFNEKAQKRSDGLQLRINKVPEVLHKMRRINKLKLDFTGKVIIPEWMDDIHIGKLMIEGEMTKEERHTIWKRFPTAIVGYQRMNIDGKPTLGAIKGFFEDLSDIPCPITEKLVKAGYQQKADGYIARAQREGVVVNYKQNKPLQYWHLMTYCDSRSPEQIFTKHIVCGELIFWMAEVSNALSVPELEKLADKIIKNPSGMEGDRPIYDRIKWNREIQKECFDKIMNEVKCYWE